MFKIFTFYNLFSAFSAFIVWGGWSYYINYQADPSMGLISGLAQGSSSFLVTFITVVAIAKIYYSLTSKFSKILLPAVIIVAILTIFMTIIHILVGTPQILYTITPSLSMTFVFCIATAYKLSLDDNKLVKS